MNNYKTKILIDTGATKTFINNRILHHLVPRNTILKQPYSFLLADGVAPFHVLGLVKLSIKFNDFITTIDAHIAQHLCTDMIIGMDYINKYNMNINVKKQIVTLELLNQRIVVPIVNAMKSIKIPVVSSNSLVLPPRSIQKISVLIPISSISLPFAPLASFKYHTFIDTKNKNLHFRNYRCNIVLSNITMTPKIINKGTCVGHLFCCSMFQHPRTFHSSYYKSFGATKNVGMIPAPNNLITDANSSIPSSEISQTNIQGNTHFLRCSDNIISIPTKSFDPISMKHLNSLVVNIQNDQQKRDISSLLMRFYSIFDITRHNIARTSIPHVINTIPHSPPASRPYPQPDKEEAMYKLVQEFLEAGLISESTSPYAAPAILVKKKDQSYRLVVDYKRLNAITIKDSSPLPNMEDTLQKLGKGFSYFSKLDLKSGFYQIPINHNDKEKTAFVTPFGLYQFNVLPMGLRNSPPTFQKVMTDTLKSCRQFSLVYLDDIIVFSRSFSDHLVHLKEVFLALQTKNLVLNPLKCELAVTRIDYLGHTIAKNSITPMKDKIEAILKIEEPRTLSQANRFLGALGWYRKFIQKFADVAAPIHAVTNLTKSNRRKFKWQNTQSEAFHKLKLMLVTEPLFLHYPVDDLPLILTTDASDIAIGGVLQQEVNGNIHNLYYHSQLLTPCQKKYSTIEKEALAIYKCFERMRAFILGRNIIIMTDHCPLCYIMQKSIKNNRINRVTHLIQEYNIDKIVHIQGRYNCLPDYLSRYSKEINDELFDVEYGLAGKNNYVFSPLTSSNNMSHSHYVDNSTTQNILAAMTLRPRKNQTKITNETRVVENDVDTHQEFDIVSHSEYTNKKKVASHISQNYFDVAKLEIEQKRDPKIQKIIRYLNSESNKSSFVVDDNILYKLITLNKYSNKEVKVIYLPSSMISSLLRACHDDPMTGAHFATDRMYYKIRTHFWWPGMKFTIQRYVKACSLCIQI